MTTLDFVGIYDPLTRLKTMGFLDDFAWDICAFTREVIDPAGLRITPQKVAEPLTCDMVVVPGGFATRDLVRDHEFIGWLQTARDCKLKVSVCTGSVLLGAAGFLEGKKATTHRTALEELRPFCLEVVDRRIVDAGDVITARGVTSAIDLGLYLCEKLAGREVRERIQKQMDYQQD
jgi:cyclohexyl-isocyanide hydratase